MIENYVIKTNSGIITRVDPGIGILSYSQYSGACFITPDHMADHLLKWLNMETNIPPTDEHLKGLGPGWAIPKDKAEYPIPHLLPLSDEWKYIFIKNPISINWMITGKCPLACKYCYADDLMFSKVTEPSKDDIQKIAKSILFYKPLSVIITGGEPLLSPYIADVFNFLDNKTGIILDTSGTGLTSIHLELFRKYNVFVRVSLDSERPQVNDDIRRFRSGYKSPYLRSSSTNAFHSICELLDAGISVGVQSVATCKNRNDLEVLGDKLFKLGVSSWRILLMIETSSNKNMFQSLQGSQRGVNRLHNQTINRILKKHSKDWNSRMTVQVVSNSCPNSVIIIGPNGNYYTESNLPLAGKVIIDNDNPKNPSIDSIHEKVNMHAHVERYLNIIRNS
jgi:MoaA/NifB/PqqE/SkfB family radical SAM enzyme